ASAVANHEPVGPIHDDARLADRAVGPRLVLLDRDLVVDREVLVEPWVPRAVLRYERPVFLLEPRDEAARLFIERTDLFQKFRGRLPHQAILARLLLDKEVRERPRGIGAADPPEPQRRPVAAESILVLELRNERLDRGQRRCF